MRGAIQKPDWIEQESEHAVELVSIPNTEVQQRKDDGPAPGGGCCPAVLSVQKRGLSVPEEVSQEKVVHPCRPRSGIQDLL